jgi:hypothetical protein
MDAVEGADEEDFFASSGQRQNCVAGRTLAIDTDDANLMDDLDEFFYPWYPKNLCYSC